jgi:hypothetical protein
MNRSGGSSISPGGDADGPGPPWVELAGGDADESGSTLDDDASHVYTGVLAEGVSDAREERVDAEAPLGQEDVDVVSEVSWS